MSWSGEPHLCWMKVIDRGKRSYTLSEVKPVENINKNLQSFLEISPAQKEFLLSHKQHNHAYDYWNPLPPEIDVGMHFHAWTWNYPGIFTCWWTSLLVATSNFGLRRYSGTRNTYPRILEVTGQVWESKKRISIDTSYRCHQRSSP